MPKDPCIDDHYHVVLDENENIRLKFDSPRYVQIQGQLGVCQKQWCDFVFYTKKALLLIVYILMNSSFRELLKNLRCF